MKKEIKNKGGIPSQDNSTPNKGVPTKESSIPIKTGNEAGIDANKQAQQQQEVALPTLDTLKRQEQEAVTQISQLGKSAPVVESLINDMLDAKAQAAPYDERIAKVQKGLQKKTLTGYMNEGLTLDQSIQLLSQDIADANSKLSFYESKKQEAATSVTDAVKSITDNLNAQLSALGLQVQSIGQQKSFLQAEEQFNRQMAARGGGQGRGKDPESAFRSAVGDAILALDSGKLEWGTAWDVIKTQFPEKSNEEIDAALGGNYSNPADPQGRAKSTFGQGTAEITDQQVWNQIGQLSPEDQSDTEYVRNQIMSLGKDPSKFGY